MPDTPDNQGFQPVSQPGFQPVPSQPTAPPQYPPAAPPPYQPMAAPPPKQGTSALKIVLIIVGILFGIGVIGAGVVGYGIYKVAKAVKMSTNSSQPVTESDLGVAIYPGAEQGKGTLRMKLAGKSMVTANYLTSDTKDQVETFYQNNLGPMVRSSTNANGETFVLNKGSGETVTVTVVQNPGLNNGQTQIVIVHAANALN
jgi:hypothetical protein